MRVMSKAWYLVAAGFFVTGVAIAATGVSQFMSTIEGMHRVPMPGKAEIFLPIGTSTLYVESRSVVGGKAYQVIEGTDFRCGVADAAGTEVPIERPASSVTYSIGSYAGHNAFDVRPATAGTYTLACDGEGEFVMAVGGGVGTWIVVALVGGLVPIGAGVILFLVVLLLRHNQKRRIAPAPAPPGPAAPPAPAG